jgi:hypothetical protein
MVTTQVVRVVPTFWRLLLEALRRMPRTQEPALRAIEV